MDQKRKQQSRPPASSYGERMEQDEARESANVQDRRNDPPYTRWQQFKDGVRERIPGRRTPDVNRLYAALADAEEPSAARPARAMARDLQRITAKVREGETLSDADARTLAGHRAWQAEVGEPMARTVMGAPTGASSVVSGIENVRKGLDDGDAWRVAGGAGEAALGLVPGAAAVGARVIRPLFGTVGRGTATGFGLSAPLAVAESRDAYAAKSRDEVARELRGLSPDAIKTHQRKVGANPDGQVGPDTIDKTLQWQTREDAGARDRQELERERIRVGGEAAKEAAKIKAEADARIAEERERLAREQERKATAAKTPFRDLYPEIMPWLPVAAATLSGGAGGLVKSLYGKAYDRRLTSLDSRARGALAADDQPLASRLVEAANRERAAGPGGTWPAIAIGAGIGAETAIMPEEIDLWRGVPGAWERATDAEAMGKRAGVGAIIGGIPAATSAKIVGAKQNARFDHPDLSPEVTTYSPAARAQRQMEQSGLDRNVAITRERNRQAVFEAESQTQRQMERALDEARARARGAGASGGAGPGSPPAGQAGAGAGPGPGSPPQPPLSHGGPPSAPAPQLRFAEYDPAVHGPVAREILDDLLTQAQRSTASPLTATLGDDVARAVEARFMLRGAPQVNPGGLRERATGTVDELRRLDALLRNQGRGTVTAPSAREDVLGMATGRDWTLAVPIMFGAGAAGLDWSDDPVRNRLVDAAMGAY